MEFKEICAINQPQTLTSSTDGERLLAVARLRVRILSRAFFVLLFLVALRYDAIEWAGPFSGVKASCYKSLKKMLKRGIELDTP